MTIQKHLPPALLKNNCPGLLDMWKNLKNKICWEVPYSVNFSKCISNDFQFYLKTAIGRCLWLFEFKNWLVIPISATGFDFFSLRIWYLESTLIFSINVCTTHFSSIWKFEIPRSEEHLSPFAFSTITHVHTQIPIRIFIYWQKLGYLVRLWTTTQS